MQRFTSEVEGAKISLSSQPLAKIDIDPLLNGRRFETVLTQKYFEETNEDLLASLLQPLEQVITGGFLPL